jgi:serine protease AprX
MRVTLDRAAVCCALLVGSIALSSCGGGGGGGGSTPPTATPTIAPTSTPTPSTGTEADYQCPSSATVSTAVGRAAASDEALRRAMNRPPANAPAATTSLLAVTYDAASLARSTASVAAGETRAGVTFLRQYDFAAIGRSVRVVAVASGQAAVATAALRTQSGVRNVGPTGLPRYATTVTTLSWPNDPYFNGFTTTVAPTATATVPPATYQMLPYVEGSSVPGQWDMHAIGLEHAFAYALPANGSGVVNANAAGSPSVQIAIIDTGEDPNHPELAGKIVYQHCYITDPNGVQSSGDFAPDPQGHGTNVSGIAAAATGNALGFTGAGGAAEIDAFRVFPTPSDACATPESTAKQCQSSSSDITSAIVAATARHVNVISMSLGGGVCTTPGDDPDPLEGAAVANAIVHGIVVIAASGNVGGAVTSPACDTGVIAVGASALDDGQTNGSGHTGGSAANPIEYVASYSNSGSSAAAPNDPAAWGIVAPGGDPKADPNDPTGVNADTDDLHWIENVWTTTPFDTKFASNCGGDYGNAGGTGDCRVLIAGTSMATPHVAGIAALIIAANPLYQNATKMKALLCTTADDIGDPHEGCGRIDAYRAMAVAVGDPLQPTPRP